MGSSPQRTYVRTSMGRAAAGPSPGSAGGAPVVVEAAPCLGRGPHHLPERPRRGGAAGGRDVPTALPRSLTDRDGSPPSRPPVPVQAGGSGGWGRSHQNPVSGELSERRARERAAAWAHAGSRAAAPLARQLELSTEHAGGRGARCGGSGGPTPRGLRVGGDRLPNGRQAGGEGCTPPRSARSRVQV